jgi:hypothetical protein
MQGTRADRIHRVIEVMTGFQAHWTMLKKIGREGSFRSSSESKLEIGRRECRRLDAVSSRRLHVEFIVYIYNSSKIVLFNVGWKILVRPMIDRPVKKSLRYRPIISRIKKAATAAA